MSALQPADLRHILILKADRLCGDALRHSAHLVFPRATVVTASRLAEARAALSAEVFDLLITGVVLLDGDVLELLAACTDGLRRVRRVLVVTGRRDPRVLGSLRALPIAGVFDPLSEGLEALGEALTTVATGRVYWSESVPVRLSSRASGPASICRTLSPVEQLVFAVLGDGTDDRDAADRLGMTPSSIQTVRRALHRKLGVQHKGGLVRLAAQYGFVQFTPEGVVRPGFAQLLAACRSSKFRRLRAAEVSPACAPLRALPSSVSMTDTP